MREWINVLLEAEGKKTKTKTSTAQSQADDIRSKFAGPESGSVPAAGSKTKQDIDPTKVKTTGKRGAQQKMSQMARNPEYQRAASSMMQNMPADMMQVDPEDEEAADTYGVDPEPTEPENLPANPPGQEVDQEGMDPEWIKVKDLPGYMFTQLRQLAKQIFGEIIPIRNFGSVNFISTLTHREDEVKVVAKWVQQNAMKDDDAYYDVEVIPGYTVRAQLYRTDNANFLVAKDWMGGQLAGHYVYMWEGGRGTDVGSEEKGRIQ